MARILIIQAGWHGQTARIAERIAQTLARYGHVVVLGSALDPDASHDLARWDGVIVGGAIHRGKHHAKLVRLVRGAGEALASRPTAFYSVSLSAAGSPRQRETARRMLAEFLEETGWIPDETAIVAGALQYSRYNVPVRLLIRLIASLSGRDTDTSRDHEYTDWDTVDRFAASFAQRLPIARAA
jgi:menaquinone-dependent protoporphyrinogen oxidase